MRAAVLLALCIGAGTLGCRPPADQPDEFECRNPSDGIVRVDPVADPHRMALHLVQAVPLAFTAEPGDETGLDQETLALVRGVAAQLLVQWADEVRAAEDETGVARVQALQARLDGTVENSARTGGEYRWHTHGNELFPIGGSFAVANQEWFSFLRLIRGGTNCVGQMLLIAELVRDETEMNHAAEHGGHWVNVLGSTGSQFQLDAWSDIPPYSEQGGASVLSWEEALELAEQEGDRPMAISAFSPALATTPSRICTSSHWEYSGQADAEDVYSLTPYFPQNDGERALMTYLRARVHQVYGEDDAAWDTYEELHAQCDLLNFRDPNHTVLTFCRASVTHMTRLRPDEPPCGDCWEIPDRR